MEYETLNKQLLFISLLLHTLFLFKENLTPMNYLMVEQKIFMTALPLTQSYGAAILWLAGLISDGWHLPEWLWVNRIFDARMCKLKNKGDMLLNR